jgi:hypothetical protein
VVDLLGRQAVADLLRPGGVLTREQAVVQSLKADAPLGELLLEVLVAVDTELGVTRSLSE